MSPGPNRLVFVALLLLGAFLVIPMIKALGVLFLLEMGLPWYAVEQARSSVGGLSLLIVALILFFFYSREEHARSFSVSASMIVVICLLVYALKTVLSGGLLNTLLYEPGNDDGVLALACVGMIVVGIVSVFRILINHN